MGDRRRDRLIQEREHDPYKPSGKLPDPTACTECRAMYRDGRWRWGSPPADAKRVLCPACQRIRDGYPAGRVSLSGDFVGDHREELVGLIRGVEERESKEHPLKRIMEIADSEDGLTVTTADSGLSRNIGDALERAYAGELDYEYPDDGDLLRVRWVR